MFLARLDCLADQQSVQGKVVYRQVLPCAVMGIQATCSRMQQAATLAVAAILQACKPAQQVWFAQYLANFSRHQDYPAP